MVVMVTEFGLKAYTLITSKTSRASYVKSSQEKPKSIGTEMNGVEGSKQHGKGKTAKLKQIPSKVCARVCGCVHMHGCVCVVTY